MPGNWFAARQLRRCALVSVRDEQSLHWLERQPELKEHPQLLLSADPILAASFAPAAQIWHGDGAAPYALVIPKATGDLPHKGDPTTEAQALASMCEELAQCGLSPVLLPLHSDQDTALCRAVAAHCPAASLAQPQQPVGNHIWSLIGKAALVVSYRLHGLVAAAAQGVPGFGVAYDPKVSALCEQLGLLWCFPAEVHEPEALGKLRMLALTLENARERLAGPLDAARVRIDASRKRFREVWGR
jgi:polysaccharide pyruvyl transferase WcaK-like protein